MSRPTPRRPASSRGQTPRPRKIAGQSGQSGTPTPRPAEDADELEAEVDEPTAPVDVPADDEPVLDDRPARPGVLARPKTTRVLIATLVLVTVALVGEAAVFVIGQLRDDSDGPRTDGSPALSVPTGRPVVAGTLQVRDGVEAAAKAAQEIVSVDYQKYDDEVDKAADLMTARFEKQYRETAGDIKDQVVGQQTVVQASVVAQGVVRANRTRLEALVFLNQVVTRTREGKPETVVTPFKVLVTMVHTDHGWLVDKLDTDASDGKASAPAPTSSDLPSPIEDKTN